MNGERRELEPRLISAFAEILLEQLDLRTQLQRSQATWIVRERQHVLGPCDWVEPEHSKQRVAQIEQQTARPLHRWVTHSNAPPARG